MDTRTAQRGRPTSIDAANVSLIAVRLFETNGYDATSMDDIAQAAGVSRRSLFRYFPVKAALVWEGFDSFLLDLGRRLDAAPFDAAPFDDAVAHSIERCLADTFLARGDGLRLTRIRLQIVNSHPELRSFGSVGLLAVRDRLRSYVESRWQLPPGSLEATVIADATTAASFAALLHWAVATTDATPADTLRRAMQALGRLFGAG